MDELIAIVRECVRCKQWLSIDEYVPHGKICKRCFKTHPHGGTTSTGIIRGLVVTEKGREAIKGILAA